MNGSVLVICPRGGAGENFAGIMAKEMEKYNGEARVGFAYPYLPEYQQDNPILLQQMAAIVRDATIEGVTEFLFTDTALTPILPQISSMLPADNLPELYNPITEARAFFNDPQERPVWLDKWEVMQKMEGFDTLYSQDRQELRDLIEEVIYRTRGVTGGNTESVPANLKADLVNEEYLRTRAAQLIFKLAEKPEKRGILIGNIDLATALTRYIDEEYRGYMDECNFIQLAQVLAMRLI